VTLAAALLGGTPVAAVAQQPFTGTWTGTYTFGRMSAVLQQTGGAVTGQITDAAGCVWGVSGSGSGAQLSLPSWTLRPPAPPLCIGGTVTMSGTLANSLTTITGSGTTVLASGATHPWTFTLTRTGGLILQVLDPACFTKLLCNGDFVDPHKLTALQNPTILAKASVERSVAVADGATRLLLRVVSTEPVAFTANVEPTGSPQGRLLNIDGTPLGGPVMPATVGSEQLAFAVYEVPAAVSPLFADDSIKLQLTATAGSKTGGATVPLVRPLPVMIHGVWSSAEIWKDFEDYLMAQGYTTCNPSEIYQGCRVHYGLYHDGAPGFDPAGSPAVDALRRKIAEVLDLQHSKDIAATRVDVIAHSMGGLVTRSRMKQHGYEDRTNFGKGTVNRLITVGTPHQGSPFADWLSQHRCDRRTVLSANPGLVLPISVTVTLEEVVSKATGPYGPGVYDLQTNSAAIANLGATPGLMHSIVGIAPASTSQEALLNFLLSQFGYGGTVDQLHDPQTQSQHDIIVPAVSQRGGLSLGGGTSSTFAGVVHASYNFSTVCGSASNLTCTETSSRFVFNRLLDLLRDEGTAFAPAFPAHLAGGIPVPYTPACPASPLRDATPTAARAEAAAPNVAITITPAAGTVVQPGDTIQVTFGVTGEADVDAAWITVGDDIMLFEGQGPFVRSYQVPANRAGRLDIIGRTFGSGASDYQGVTYVMVTPVAAPTAIGSTPAAVMLRESGQRISLRIDATYANASKLDVTGATAGTSYSLGGTPGVVTVSANGLVEARASGQASIIIQHGALTVSVPVTVNISNHAPTVSGGPEITLTAGEVRRLDLAVADRDNNSLTVAGINLPSFARVQYAGGATAQLSLEPRSSDVGVFSMVVSAVDNGSPPLEGGHTIRVVVLPAAANPVGVVDTPLDNSTGVTGAVPFTGWALDDVAVARVMICRAPFGNEVAPIDPNCAGMAQIFVGFGVFIDGARPDVQAAFPTYPGNGKAGWGFMVLTNTLPNQGNGTYQFSVYAQDRDGHATLLGTRTLTCDNARATKPFGTIDTPTQGGPASGAAFVNFGWALTPQPKFIPPDGSTIAVLVDGVLLGPVDYNHERPDIEAAFPDFQNTTGTNGAVGFRVIDTTTLINGLHTISWTVTDSQGVTEGIGSRFFTVSNGSGAVTASAERAAPNRVRATADVIAAAPPDPTPILARRGWDLKGPWRALSVDGGGRAVIRGEEVDRFELALGAHAGASYTGHLRVGQELVRLPLGSRLNTATGHFTWAPVVGFIGRYDLVFVRWDGTRAAARHEVRVILAPKGSGHVGVQVAIDAPRSDQDVGQPFMLAGWAADLDAASGTGIDTVHVWAYPSTGGPPIFLGATAYGGSRPGVAAVHGNQFEASGFSLPVQGLRPGSYDLAVFAWSIERSNFVPARTVRVQVRP
jgi:hypothetical protein